MRVQARRQRFSVGAGRAARETAEGGSRGIKQLSHERAGAFRLTQEGSAGRWGGAGKAPAGPASAGISNPGTPVIPPVPSCPLARAPGVPGGLGYSGLLRLPCAANEHARLNVCQPSFRLHCSQLASCLPGHRTNPPHRKCPSPRRPAVRLRDGRRSLAGPAGRWTCACPP